MLHSTAFSATCGEVMVLSVRYVRCEFEKLMKHTRRVSNDQRRNGMIGITIFDNSPITLGLAKNVERN